MARVTVEDCVEVVPNRFELVALASQRAKDIAAGSPLTLDRDNDKNPVVALREIADKTISVDVLRETLVQGAQRKVKTDKFEEDPSLLEDGTENMDILQEIESLNVKEDISDMDGMSFDDENMDVED